jgi:hypothetical protein
VRIASSKYGDLVPEPQDLDVLGCVGPGERRQASQHPGERQVCESKSHGERSCWAACWRRWRGQPAAKALLRGRDRVLGTHTATIGGNGFRSVGAIDALEAELGRPVLTANQVLLWAALRAAAADSAIVEGYGRLFGTQR